MIISVDVGTSSIKVGLVDDGGNILRSYAFEVPLIIETHSAAEHNLRLLWELTLQGIRKVVRGCEGRVEAISLSTYLHGLALLNSNFEVITNVITHLDRRSAKMQKVLEEFGEELYRRTGCPPIFIFPLCRALWLRDKGILTNTSKLCFVKDYLTYRLVGRHVVDYGVASGTGFLNIHSLKWEPLSLELSNVSEEMLPELYEGAKVYDYINLREVGVNDKVALVLGSFDGALQNIGYDAFGTDAVLNLGSTAVIRTLLREPVIDRSQEARFFTYYAADNYRAVGGASNNGTVVIEWFKKVLNSDTIPITKNIVCRDGVYVLPFLSGERYPFRDPNLAFTLLGLHLEHKLEDIVRAIMEGMALTVKVILIALEENGVRVERVHCAGGGCSNIDLTNIFSKALCKPIAIHASPRDAVILGASKTAMRALEHIKSLDYLREDQYKQLTYIYPDPEDCTTYNQCLEIFLKLVKTIRNTYRELTKT